MLVSLGGFLERSDNMEMIVTITCGLLIYSVFFYYQF
jgi:hypothetical protein